MKWTEASGRAAVLARSGGFCEIHGTHLGAEWSHRRSRAQLGAWSPTNGLRVCRTGHAWLEAEPVLAAAGGWRLVHDDRDPADVPAWLAWPYVGWWRLFLADDAEGVRRHLIEPVDPTVWGLPVRPAVLPPMERAA